MSNSHSSRDGIRQTGAVSWRDETGQIGREIPLAGAVTKIQLIRAGGSNNWNYLYFPSRDGTGRKSAPDRADKPDEIEVSSRDGFYARQGFVRLLVAVHRRKREGFVT